MSEWRTGAAPEGVRPRVLVVDDEPIIRIDLREALTEMGYEVVAEAGDGEDAVAKARGLTPDLVFLDIKMPGIDGLEALRRMNEDGLRPVIILTAFGESDLVERAADLGAAAYLVKPFRTSALAPAITLALRHFEELATLRGENASLRETVEAGRLVNRAKSLLAEREGITEQEAFRMIQKTSMDRNKKMKEIAEAIILVYGGP